MNKRRHKKDIRVGDLVMNNRGSVGNDDSGKMGKVLEKRGAWIELDRYVRSHTHTQFSHGICPECHARLYPGFPYVAGAEARR